MMGYPKQPGQDAKAHLRLAQRSLAQSKEIAALKARLAEVERERDEARDKLASTAYAVTAERVPRLEARIATLSQQLAEARGALEKAGTVCDAAQSFDDLCSWKLSPEDEADGLLTPGYPLGGDARAALNQLHDALLARAALPNPESTGGAQ